MNRVPFRLSLLLLLLVLAAGPARAQSGADPSAPAATEQRPQISEDERYHRTLVYTVAGSHIYQKINALLVASEVKRRQDNNIPLGGDPVSDLDVEARIERTLSDFKKTNPDLDFWAQVKLFGYTDETYRGEIRHQLELENLFFPHDLEKWPTDILKEVFGGNNPDEEAVKQSLWGSLVKDMPTTLGDLRAKGEPGEIDPTVMKMFLRPRLFGWLMDKSTIEFPFDGLPEGICLRVDGTVVTTAEMVEFALQITSDVQLEWAATWTELITKLEADLAAKGKLLTHAETQAIITEERKEFVQSYITYEQLALEFMGFPTMELFHQWKRLRESFRDTLPDPVPVADLQANLDARRLFLGGGKVNAEIILISARDLDSGVWPKEGSFAKAAQRAELVAQKLIDGDGWSRVLDAYSELPETTRGSAQGMPQPKRGRLGAQMLNPLRQFLGENDYTYFLTGHSVADDIFFRAEEKAVYGPREGILGYYLYKVLNREQPTNEIDFQANERHAFLVGDDYLTQRFQAYIAEVMGR